jgi:hypothetical protein
VDDIYPLHIRRSFERRWAARIIRDDTRRSPPRGTDTCPGCGNLVTAPISSTYLPTGKIVNHWRCSVCDNSWETFVDPC